MLNYIATILMDYLDGTFSICECFLFQLSFIQLFLNLVRAIYGHYCTYHCDFRIVTPWVVSCTMLLHLNFHLQPCISWPPPLISKLNFSSCSYFTGAHLFSVLMFWYRYYFLLRNIPSINQLNVDLNLA